MAFANTVKDTMPGFGSPGTYSKREGVATNVGTTNITVPSAGTFSSNGNGPGIRRGKVRVKTATLTAGGTVQLGAITATDGSSTFAIQPQMTALGANVLLDTTIEFSLDIMATSITVPITAGVANSTHDVEVTGVA